MAYVDPHHTVSLADHHFAHARPAPAPAKDDANRPLCDMAKGTYTLTDAWNSPLTPFKKVIVNFRIHHSAPDTDRSP
jgi:hypothetical protein